MKGGPCTCRWPNKKGGGLRIASSRGVASQLPVSYSRTVISTGLASARFAGV